MKAKTRHFLIIDFGGRGGLNVPFNLSKIVAVMQGSGYYQRDKTRWRTLYWLGREIIQRTLAIIPWHSFAASNSEEPNYFFSRPFSVLFNFSPVNKYLF